MKKKNKLRNKKILLALLSVLLVFVIGLALFLSRAGQDETVVGGSTGIISVEDTTKELVLSVVEDTAHSIKT